MSMSATHAAFVLIKRFIETDPRQAASALENLPEDQAASILKNLTAAQAAHCLELIQPVIAADILERLIIEPANAILSAMRADAAADVLRAFTKEAQSAILEGLSPQRKDDLRELLSYPQDSAGRLMQTDAIALHRDLKVKEAIARLRALAPKKPSASYTYVVDSDNRLLGVLNMRDLILASAEQTIGEIMRTEVFCVGAFTDREELIHIAGSKHYISFPVIDHERRLLGVVKTQDLIASSQEEATEDLQLMFGASAEERPFSALSFKITKRLPWLYINLATAFLAASVVAMFEGLIDRIAILAVFLPIVAGQGGNAGNQTLAVALRGLVMRDIRPKDARRLIALEMTTGLLNGVAIGLVTALIAWLWQGNPYLGLIIGLAMIVNMLAAGMAGAAIPITMKRLGFDPAQSSGIFLTTVTDVVGFLSFLGFATFFQSKLL